MIRRYSELKNITDFEQRFEYLKIGGEVGAATFGFDRYINQGFYSSREWKRTREIVIIRDNGCDLGIPGYEIHSELLVHHMNPISLNDILHGEENLINPEFLITTTQTTHNAIHYGDNNLLIKPYKPREPGDTRLW